MRRAASRTVVLGLVALGMLSLPGALRAAPPSVDPTLSPPAGRDAVREGDTLTFGGTVEAGATLVAAELRFLDEDGNTARDSLDTSGHVELDDGAILGRDGLPNLCPEPTSAPDCRGRLNDGTVELAVTVERGGETATGVSNGVPVDMLAPFILRTELIAEDRVRVTFSEEVHLPAGESDSSLDWIVGGTCVSGANGEAGQPPLSVEGTGKVRFLNLAIGEDEDATPLVSYCPGMTPSRPSYRDRVSRTLTGGRAITALDRVAPDIPVITQIAGHGGANVLANDPDPTVRLSDLRPGHFGQVYLESGDQAGFQRLGDTFLGEAEAGQSGIADVQLPDLGEDGTYPLYGVARDRAACTTGSSEECPNHSGADSATYRLDTLKPEALFASTDGPEVTVRFSEPVSGTDDPAQWTITPGGPVTQVGGAGNERLLAVSNAPAGAQVTWAPPLSGAYADGAGNQVDGFVLEALDRIPPVITVADPAARVVTDAASYRITGSVSKPESLLEAFRGPTPAAQSQLGPGETDFALGVDLFTDQPNDFTLRATDPLGNVSQDTPAPTIVQDSASPIVDVLAPAPGALLPGGEPTTIEWTASDANFGPGPVSIFYSPDGGTTWEPITKGQPNDGRFEWITPDDASVWDRAKIRILVEDLAGHTTDAESGLFSIDADPPAFGAVTIDTRHVAVQFTEPVTGTAAADEWTIDGKPAGAVADGATPMSKVILETLPTQEIGRNDKPLIAYDPSDLPGRQELRDQAGNVIPEGARTVKAEDGIVPIDPVIARIAGHPADGMVTSGDSTPTVSVRDIVEGDRAEVFVESDGQPGFTGGDRFVGSAIADETEAFVTTSHLGPDAIYTLYARAMDPGGNISLGADDAEYRLDTGPPELILMAPEGGELLAGGSTFTIRWEATDADFGGQQPIHIESTVDGGSTWQFVADTENDGEHGWEVPGADTTKARIRVRAMDALGQTSQQQSGLFTIDATPPRFGARTVDADHILVEFTEPVSGTTVKGEWTIDLDGDGPDPSFPATGVSPKSGENITELTLTTFPTREVRGNDTPTITYEPLPNSTAFRDAAGNVVPENARDAVAADEIAPLKPSLDAFDNIVNSRKLRLAGTAEAGPGNEGNKVLARRLRPAGAVGAREVEEDGRFTMRVALAQNAKNVFEVWARDPSGNLSPKQRIKVIEDSARPRVTVKSRKKPIRDGRRFAIRWRTREARRDFAIIKYRAKPGGKGVIFKKTADDGRQRWRVPSKLDGRRVQIRVISVDKAGNRGSDWGPWFRVK